MSLVQFGTNVASIRKKTVAFYNRSGSAVTVYEGMPVCYMYDTTNNVLGINKATNAKGATTAEGYQNEGKFLIVELPEIDNQDWFGGVVAAGPWCNKSVATLATKWLDVYEPNGAVVPVRAAVKCVSGRTILAMTDDGQALVNPFNTVPNFGVTAGASDSRPVAIAEETRALSNVADASISVFADNSSSVAGTVKATCTHLLLAGTTGVKISGTDDYDGAHTVTYVDSTHFYFTATWVATDTGTMSKNIDIVLARLCPNEFVHQGGQIGYEMQIAAGTAATAVNRMNLSFLQTSGNCNALHYRTLLSGGAGASRGVYRFETFMAAATGENTFGLQTHLEISAVPYSCWAGPLKIGIRSRVVDPDLSGLHLTAINIDWILAAAAGNPLSDPPVQSTILYVNTEAGATSPDYFLVSEQLLGVGAVAGAKSGTGDGSIKIRLGGIDYWLQYWSAASG